MVTRLICLLLLCTASAGLYAEPITRSFTLAEVTELEFNGDITVHFTQSDNAQALVTLVDGDWDDVDIDEDKSRFKVTGKSGFWSFWGVGDAELEVEVSLPNLEWIELIGEVAFYAETLNAGDMRITMVGASFMAFKQSLKVENLVVEMTGATKLEAKTLIANDAKMELTGASNLEASGGGTLTTLTLQLSGASNFVAKPLVCRSASVSASGASNIALEVVDQLKANLSGASNVRYGGSPSLEIKTSGASTVKTF
ncbi:GIN domain-containing protein [Gilvimarinus chinensis]|uniref:GIN domain-containing protein n=1 Tax=Gilvimarinus chinensis TaxID=396005 RepID=UPI000372EA05|nr:DUF2807 domain-containing protein [Gilvimarinus chinensis]